MTEFNQELMNMVLPAIGTAVSVMVTWGLYELRKFVRTKTNNDSINGAMDILSDMVQTTVVCINQETKTLTETGFIGKEEQKALKRKARVIVLGQLKKATKKILEKNINDLEVYVDHRIEATVNYENRVAR